VIYGSANYPDLRPLENGKLFVSGASFVDNSVYFTIDPSHAPPAVGIISSNSKLGSAFGLSEKQIDEIWFKGEKKNIHAWVIKPSHFSPDEKYPLAYIIHGGPQSAWNNGWSTRWNPAVFAEQGYVVICPNPTGSTGYGQELTDGIQKQWGGTPYQDLVHGFNYIESKLHYVDTARAVALGASYGGSVAHDFGDLEGLLTS
jgi:dipeptidyl aminopeptidase/acylaminoacyl peptidase